MPNREGINLTNPITIVDSSLNKNAFWADEGVGGLHQKLTLVDRNNIVPARRVEGLLVYVSETGKYYQLEAGYSTTNTTLLDTDWEELQTGGTSGTPVIYNFTNGLITTTSVDGLTKTIKAGSADITEPISYRQLVSSGVLTEYYDTIINTTEGKLSLTYINSVSSINKHIDIKPYTSTIEIQSLTNKIGSVRVDNTGNLIFKDILANGGSDITLSQLWGRGSVGGSDTQVQFNDAGTLNGFGAYTKTQTNLAIGTNAKAYRKSQVAKGDGGFNSVKGTAQITEDSVYTATTNATPTTLKINTDVLSISNNQTTISAHINVACYNSTSNLSAGWLFWGVFKRDASGTVSLVGTPMLLAERKETGMESTTCNISTVNKEINIVVTGIASTDIRWHAGVYSSEVSYNEPSYVLPINYTYGRLYNWYAASSRSYGMLYNWYAATDVRNIAPTGWHVPTQNEYTTLINYCGGLNTLGIKLKEQGTTYWVGPSNGTNEVGFNLIGCGFRSASFSGDFREGKQRTYLRTTTLTILLYQGDDAFFSNKNEKDGYSIRLLKDDSTDLGTMTGNDGKQYATVKIGNQVWMAETLEETKFRDGSTIPIVTDNTAWSNLTTAGACWYNNIRTYDLAPVGWHLPNLEEYTTLQTYLGGASVAGGKLKEAGSTHWEGGGTNESGFTALGTGYRYNASVSIKAYCYLQISDLYNDACYIAALAYSEVYFYITNGGVGQRYTGNPVRFIRNINSVLTTQPVDAEGNIYETVTIGTQTWTKQNHKSKKWRTGENINVQDVYTDGAWAALTIPACCAYNNDENNV